MKIKQPWDRLLARQTRGSNRILYAIKAKYWTADRGKAARLSLQAAERLKFLMESRRTGDTFTIVPADTIPDTRLILETRLP